MESPTEDTLAATALVDKWAKEYRGYLKDGGGNAHAIHPAARAALIDHVTRAFAARVAKRPDLARKTDSVPLDPAQPVESSDVFGVNADAEAIIADKPKRGRKAKAAIAEQGQASSRLDAVE